MSTEAALERLRALARCWAELPGDDLAAEVDRRLGMQLLGVLHCADDAPGGVAGRLDAVRKVAEGWERPGGPGLFYPAAGQAVLDAIRGASTEAHAGCGTRAEHAEARLAAIADHCRQRMNAPGRSGMTRAAAETILGLAEGGGEPE